jgi:SAM-dependent methyltransferase
MTEGASNVGAVTGMYAPIAADYERIWAPLLRPYGNMLLDRVPLEGARRVLDLGCGVGRLLPDIEERAPDATVFGADLTEGMLRCAPSRFPRVAMDCTRSAFGSGSFDAVVSTFVFQHVPEPLAALRCVLEMLRPEGGIAIATWGTGEAFPAMDAWDDELDQMNVPVDPADASPGGRDLTDSPGKMAALLSKAGLTDVRTESVGWLVRWEFDEFLEWRRLMGPSRRRLLELPMQEREAAFERARDRVSAMDRESLVHRDEVILSSARAPS